MQARLIGRPDYQFSDWAIPPGAGEAVAQWIAYTVGFASGAYGVAEAAQNGMYATAAVGALLLAAGAYWAYRRHANSVRSESVEVGNRQARLAGGQAEREWELKRVADSERVPRHTENLEGLHPQFRKKVEAVVIYLEDRGYDPHVPKGSGLRSATEQAAKFAGGYSKIRSGGPHQFGMAADIVDTRWGWGEFPTSPWLGTPAYEKYWAHLRVAAEAQGLIWGGNFGPLGPYNLGWDPAHVEMPGWRQLVPYH